MDGAPMGRMGCFRLLTWAGAERLVEQWKTSYEEYHLVLVLLAITWYYWKKLSEKKGNKFYVVDIAIVHCNYQYDI